MRKEFKICEFEKEGGGESLLVLNFDDENFDLESVKKDIIHSIQRNNISQDVIPYLEDFYEFLLFIISMSSGQGETLFTAPEDTDAKGVLIPSSLSYPLGFEYRLWYQFS